MARPLQMRRTMRTFLLLLAALAPGCSSSDETEVAEITVLDHLTPYRTNQVLACMVIDEGSGPQSFCDSIDGFMYHWGSTYRLEVDIVKIPNPPPDGFSRQVRPREIIEVQPTAPRSEFTLALHGEANPDSPPLLTPAGQGFAMPPGVVMALGRQIVCQDPTVCTAIADALRRPAAFDLTLRHPDDPTDELAPLTAAAVVSR